MNVLYFHNYAQTSYNILIILTKTDAYYSSNYTAIMHSPNLNSESNILCVHDTSIYASFIAESLFLHIQGSGTGSRISCVCVCVCVCLCMLGLS